MPPREVDCNGPGIRRVGAGRGFYYRDADGRRIDDPDVLARIRRLAIPPAWRDVWICSDPTGHIQATGLDARGRRQYRYHDAWQAQQTLEKHERMERFAEALPRLRAQVEQDLAQDGMPRERVLACAVRLLDRGFFRLGGEAYAKENGSFGLATLQKRHARVQGDTIRFAYEAKGGIDRRCEVDDPEAAAVVRTLKRRRSPAGAELLAHRDDEGSWVDVRSQDVNDYIKAHLGEEFSAKDFRTWVGTVLAAVELSTEDEPESTAEERQAVVRAAAAVAEQLGNTPAVARSAYIDPRVVTRFEEQDTLDEPESLTDREELEAEVLELLRRDG